MSVRKPARNTNYSTYFVDFQISKPKQDHLLFTKASLEAWNREERYKGNRQTKVQVATHIISSTE